jgi:hypothetical protein
MRRRRCEALRVALSTARLGLHASEEGARVAMERELAELSNDLQAEIVEIEERLEEVLAVDLTEVKEQALKTAQAYERQWETAAHDLQPAADKLAELQHSGGGASPFKFPQPNSVTVVACVERHRTTRGLLGGSRRCTFGGSATLREAELLKQHSTVRHRSTRIHASTPRG